MVWVNMKHIFQLSKMKINQNMKQLRLIKIYV